MERWDTKNGNKITLYLTYRLPEYLNIRYYNEYWICRYYPYKISCLDIQPLSWTKYKPARPTHPNRCARRSHCARLRCRRGIFFFHCRNIIHYYTHMYCYLLLFFHYHLIMTCWSGYHTQNFGSFYRCYYYCYCKL